MFALPMILASVLGMPPEAIGCFILKTLTNHWSPDPCFKDPPLYFDPPLENPGSAPELILSYSV